MVMSLIGYGLTKAARTDLVASTGFEGLDLSRYRRRSKQRASMLFGHGRLVRRGIADGDIAHND